MTKIGHDETVTTNREIVANHLDVSIFYHILSSRVSYGNSSIGQKFCSHRDRRK